ncbi:MAG: 50S ribosomal protein L5 [bacterium]
MGVNLKEEYTKNIVPKLMKQLKYTNAYEVPELKKITINMGIGEAVQEPKILDEACEQLATITGQRPLITQAHKSISSFKLVKGKAIGCKVTLRKERMYEFLERLVTFALPRVRDFRGLNPDSFDKKGNYSFGIVEQNIFPEISYDKVKLVLGMDVTFTIRCKHREDSLELLTAFNIPFKKSYGKKVSGNKTKKGS